GADCIDFIRGHTLPGVKEQGYPDLDELLRLKRRLQKYGLRINRVTLPDITERFMLDLPGGEKELENTTRALAVFGEARVPIARQRFAGDVFPQEAYKYRVPHRGGYEARAESVRFSRRAENGRPAPDGGKGQGGHQDPSPEVIENWWAHFRAVYGEL